MVMGINMQVSFIIPLYNCLNLTQECLRSLQASLPASLKYEIILVDDGSTDGTREWLATLSPPCRVLLNERNLGYAGANNRGATVARGEWLFFLNNDLVLTRGWFEPMARLLRTRTDVGLVGNVQRDASTQRVDHSGVSFNRQGKPIHLKRRPPWAWLRGQRRVVAITGACFAVTAQRWRELGGFDPGFVNGCEDIDLCLRAGVAGYSNYVALRSVIGHHISQSPGRKARDEQNTRRLLQRWRTVITPFADRDAARPWSAAFIVAHWELSSVYDYRLARQAFACWLGITRNIPAPVFAQVNALLDLEFSRWEELLGPLQPDALVSNPGSGNGDSGA